METIAKLSTMPKRELRESKKRKRFFNDIVEQTLIGASLSASNVFLMHCHGSGGRLFFRRTSHTSIYISFAGANAAAFRYENDNNSLLVNTKRRFGGAHFFIIFSKLMERWLRAANYLRK